MSLQQNRLACFLSRQERRSRPYVAGHRAGKKNRLAPEWLLSLSKRSVEMQMAKAFVLIKAGIGEQLGEGKANLFQESRAICVVGED